MWYDDASMYLVLHKGLTFCTETPLGSKRVTIESYGDFSDCIQTSQEWSLECVDVHLEFVIFKIATVAIVTIKNKLKCFKIATVAIVTIKNKLKCFKIATVSRVTMNVQRICFIWMKWDFTEIILEMWRSSFRGEHFQNGYPYHDNYECSKDIWIRNFKTLNIKSIISAH